MVETVERVVYSNGRKNDVLVTLLLRELREETVNNSTERYG